MRLRPRALRAIAFAAPTLAAIALLPAQNPAPPLPVFNPAAFRASPVTNQFFPLPVGMIWVYHVHEGPSVAIDSITVTNQVKRVNGVAAIVVHDRVVANGRVKEDTHDWYAQDVAGAVWYLGEATTEYRAGRAQSTAGSWEAGVSGAVAGTIMLAHPAPGEWYRQEYRRGEAEDMGRVLSVGETVTVPAGRFTGCLTTEDWSPLEPKVREHKTYCPGVGLVRELTVAGGSERMELVSMRKP
jgi:hypothetical protein